AQVVAAGQVLAPAALAAAALVQLAAGLGQFQQVVDRGQQLGVLPGFGQVVGGTGLDQLHRALQVGPGGQQDHRQVRVPLADGREQRPALVAGGGICGEVHVLDHQVHRLALQQRQSLLRADGVHGGDVVQGEQHFQRGGDRGVVVDDQDGGHGGGR